MLLHWYGHACFLIASEKTTIMTDPFNEKVGYPLPEDAPDYVTVSHDHYDHSSVGLVNGSPQVKKSLNLETLGDIAVRGVSTFHDTEQGTARGTNTVFIFEHDGVRICHLGDLGHVLTDDQAAEIGEIDVLLIPVGGVYTVEGQTACAIVQKLTPKVIVPMHFRTRDLAFNLGPVDGFCQSFQNVIHTGQCSLNITPATLPKTPQVLVLEYCRKA
jgi:L-ascorbate metabolism protein UlaG (beta-lactamase superfamily)